MCDPGRSDAPMSGSVWTSRLAARRAAWEGFIYHVGRRQIASKISHKSKYTFNKQKRDGILLMDSYLINVLFIKKYLVNDVLRTIFIGFNTVFIKMVYLLIYSKFLKLGTCRREWFCLSNLSPLLMTEFSQ